MRDAFFGSRNGQAETDTQADRQTASARDTGDDTMRDAFLGSQNGAGRDRHTGRQIDSVCKVHLVMIQLLASMCCWSCLIQLETGCWLRSRIQQEKQTTWTFGCWPPLDLLN